MAGEARRKRPGGANYRPVKKPTAGERAPEDVIKNRPLSWGLKRVDFEGDWGWGQLDPAHLADVHRELCAMEGRTLQNLLDGAHVKDIPIRHMRRAAVERLTERGLEPDPLWELRLPVRKWRIWGIVEGAVFHLLWWDEHHTACNAPPKGERRR